MAANSTSMSLKHGLVEEQQQMRERMALAPTARGLAGEGWVWLGGASHLRHYFRNGQSLCRRYRLNPDASYTFYRTMAMDWDCWKCDRERRASSGRGEGQA
jgi:hypothetical protein